LIIIIDECLPKKLRIFFKEHTVWTVPQIGLQGAKDKDLLEELDKKGIDCFITIDGNIEYQQQFKNRSFSTIVVRSYSNRFKDLELLRQDLVEALKEVGEVKIVHVPKREVKK